MTIWIKQSCGSHLTVSKGSAHDQCYWKWELSDERERDVEEERPSTATSRWEVWAWTKALAIEMETRGGGRGTFKIKQAEGYELQTSRWVSSGELLPSTVITVNPLLLFYVTKFAAICHSSHWNSAIVTLRAHITHLPRAWTHALSFPGSAELPYNSVFYTSKSLRRDRQCSRRKKDTICDMREVAARVLGGNHTAICKWIKGTRCTP